MATGLDFVCRMNVAPLVLGCNCLCSCNLGSIGTAFMCSANKERQKGMFLLMKGVLVGFEISWRDEAEADADPP